MHRPFILRIYVKSIESRGKIVIPVYDAAGNVIETHEHKGDFKIWQAICCVPFSRSLHLRTMQVMRLY
jgi:hypothetical protein